MTEKEKEIVEQIIKMGYNLFLGADALEYYMPNEVIEGSAKKEWDTIKKLALKIGIDVNKVI